MYRSKLRSRSTTYGSDLVFLSSAFFFFFSRPHAPIALSPLAVLHTAAGRLSGRSSACCLASVSPRVHWLAQLHLLAPLATRPIGSSDKRPTLFETAAPSTLSSRRIMVAPNSIAENVFGTLGAVFVSHRRMRCAAGCEVWFS